MPPFGYAPDDSGALAVPLAGTVGSKLFGDRLEPVPGLNEVRMTGELVQSESRDRGNLHPPKTSRVLVVGGALAVAAIAVMTGFLNGPLTALGLFLIALGVAIAAAAVLTTRQLGRRTRSAVHI